MRSGLRLLIGPLVLLGMGGLAALAAEVAVRAEATSDLYGVLKVVSDLVLLLGAGWLFVAVAGAVKAWLHPPSKSRR